MFISSYTTIYFFIKNFFSNVYISVNSIFECSYLSFGCKIGHRLSMYVTRGMEGVHPKYLQVRTGGEGYHSSCVRTHLHYLFSCSWLMVFCFICRNLTLPSFKKGVFVRNGYFSSMRSISVVMKSALFYFKLFFQTKVSQSAFNFNQIEPCVYSIF